jgi:hypothetical protein
MRIMSRPETSSPRTLKSGSTSPITHASASSSRMRVIIASASPVFRAFACWCSGSFPERIEMKTMLSIPSTISSAVSVANAIHMSGLVSHSMVFHSSV